MYGDIMKDDIHSSPNADAEPNWVFLTTLETLSEKRTMVTKVDGKQIALFLREGDIFACNNRCPHEGYPLSEGHLGTDCILTCNWHNWKFDLSSGETLVGGDQLTRYETRQVGDDIQINMVPPNPAEITKKALFGLRQSFDLHEYDRMAREIGRLMTTGVDPLFALRQTIEWTFERFEFGTTHAVAACADWLKLADKKETDSPEYLTAIVESVAHFAWDSRREPHHPFTEDVRKFDPTALVQAIETEDEDTAISLIRGAFESGMNYQDIEPALAEAALAHYQDFGHSLIYVYKTGQLINRLDDPTTALQLTLMLVRSIIFASREDLIPEFKAYPAALNKWDEVGSSLPAQEELTGGRMDQILDAIRKGGADIDSIFDAVMNAAAWQMLHYDMTYQFQNDKPVSQNTTWLSFTHALTFGNAVRKMCGRYPHLWPNGLLQIGCFLGRNAAFVDSELDQAEWLVSDLDPFFQTNMEGLYDHGHPELIVSCHLLKLLVAVKEETDERPEDQSISMMVSAVNRFLNSPLKRKHPLRSAHQALAMIQAEN
jgi:nitrite reductase/ring-hydroxylating ferredoxin subunit